MMLLPRLVADSRRVKAGTCWPDSTGCSRARPHTRSTHVPRRPPALSTLGPLVRPYCLASVLLLLLLPPAGLHATLLQELLWLLREGDIWQGAVSTPPPPGMCWGCCCCWRAYSVPSSPPRISALPLLGWLKGSHIPPVWSARVSSLCRCPALTGPTSKDSQSRHVGGEPWPDRTSPALPLLLPT